jgi:uncharacterized membrane-anchored protein YjiN (DUF445 family)
MTDKRHPGDREARYGRTERKNLTLTREAIEAIGAWAGAHGLYFSVAVETLAMIGLGQQSAETLPRLVSNLLERSLNRHFNRFAKLIAYAAIAAEETSRKTDVLLLQQIRHEARQDPDRFIRNMHVSLDPGVQPDARVRALRDQLRTEAREEAIERLRKPLAEEERLLQRAGAGQPDEEGER